MPLAAHDEGPLLEGVELTWSGTAFDLGEPQRTLLHLLEALLPLRIVTLGRHLQGPRLLWEALRLSLDALAIPLYMTLVFSLLLGGIAFAFEYEERPTIYEAAGSTLVVEQGHVADLSDAVWMMLVAVVTLSFEPHLYPQQGATRVLFTLAVRIRVLFSFPLTAVVVMLFAVLGSVCQVVHLDIDIADFYRLGK